MKTVDATARFIVSEYNRAGLIGLVLGDRDFKLGAAKLKALRKNAKFPFLVANLVKSGTRTPAFEDRLVKTFAGVKVGIFGVTSNERTKLDTESGWDLLDPLSVARDQVAALKKDGAELIVAVTHLRDRLDQKLAQGLKDVNAILAGGNVKLVKHPVQEGNTYIAGAYTKGKYVSVLTLYLQDGTKPPYAFIDRFKKTGLGNKIRQLDARLATYVRMLEKRRSEADEELKKNPDSNQTRIKRGGVEYYETQLVKLRSEKQLAQAELDAAEDADPTADFIHYELTALDGKIVHDPAVEAAVVKFRAKHPKPKPTQGVFPSQRSGRSSTSGPRAIPSTGRMLPPTMRMPLPRPSTR